MALVLYHERLRELPRCGSAASVHQRPDEKWLVDVAHPHIQLATSDCKRFAAQLARWDQYEAYMSLLVNHFNPAAVPGLMCRSLVSVGWDGMLYDCDFNQMLDLPSGHSGM